VVAKTKTIEAQKRPLNLTDPAHHESLLSAVRSGARAAFYLYVGAFFCKVAWDIAFGAVEFSRHYAFEIATTILNDIFIGLLTDWFHTLVGLLIISCCGLLIFLIYISAPVWIYICKVLALGLSLFLLGFAASLGNEFLPEWAKLLIGVGFWGIFFFVASLLGFNISALARGNDRFMR
jgi:hypothetical protein